LFPFFRMTASFGLHFLEHKLARKVFPSYPTEQILEESFRTTPVFHAMAEEGCLPGVLRKTAGLRLEREESGECTRLRVFELENSAKVAVLRALPIGILGSQEEPVDRKGLRGTGRMEWNPGQAPKATAGFHRRGSSYWLCESRPGCR